MKSGAHNVLIETSNGTQGFGAVCGTGAILHTKNMYFCKQEWAIKVKAEGSNQNGAMKDILCICTNLFKSNSHPKPTKAPSNSVSAHNSEIFLR